MRKRFINPTCKMDKRGSHMSEPFSRSDLSVLAATIAAINTTYQLQGITLHILP